ncbi:MAG: hypothetical protein DHS20C03_12640 [Minwuia thermotolerans]|nr:MAG: hypothetical protein DHS20C03_12640 [Minwuia thermotolerans]
MSGIREFLAGLGRGLTESSRLSLMVCLVGALGMSAFFMFASPRLLAAGYRVIPGIAYADDDLFAFMEATRSSAAREPGRAAVFIGSSSMREAQHSREYAAYRFREHGLDIEPVDLTTSSQPFWHGISLAEEAVCQRGGVIFLGVNLARFVNDPMTYRRDSAIDPELQTPAYARSLTMRAAQFEQAVVSGTRGWLLRLPTEIAKVRGTVPEDRKVATRFDPVDGRHHYGHLPVPDEAMVAKQVAAYLKMLRDAGEFHRDEVGQMILALAMRLEKCAETAIVLTEPPINPLVMQAPEMQGWQADHDRFLNQLAARIDAERLDINASLPLQPDWFHDISHLRDRQAMKIVTDQFARKLAEIAAARGWKQ